MTGSPAIFLPRISGSDMFWSSNAWLPISSRQAHRLALRIGQLDADHAAPGDGRDARRQRRHVAGDVVGKLDHPAGLDAAGRLQLVHGDDRAGADLDDVAADVEVLEHAFEQARVALEPGAVDLRSALLRRRRRAGRASAAGNCRRARGFAARGIAAACSRATARRRSDAAGSATATAGRDLGGAALAAAVVGGLRSSRRGAAILGRGSRLKMPAMPGLLGRLEAEREIAKNEARRAQRGPARRAEPGRRSHRRGSARSRHRRHAPRPGRALRPSRREARRRPMRWSG